MHECCDGYAVSPTAGEFNFAMARQFQVTSLIPVRDPTRTVA